jgi:hypothetical protein
MPSKTSGQVCALGFVATGMTSFWTALRVVCATGAACGSEGASRGGTLFLGEVEEVFFVDADAFAGFFDVAPFTAVLFLAVVFFGVAELLRA